MTQALPQLVSSSTCFRCDVCCRFPEHDSFLRPYFTREEIAEVVAQGVPASWFPDPSGSQVNLVPHPTDEGYLCPAFDAQSGRCGIYEARPWDCQLYPLALMWDESGREVLLGWDTKCPFMREAVPSTIRDHAESIVGLLTTEQGLDKIVTHPHLVGRFQDDVVVLKSLPQLAARLRKARVDPRLHPLTPADAPRLSAALERAQVLRDDAPAAFAFPYHYIWNSVLPYWWLDHEDTLFLFAQSPDGWFMPLPPLGAGPFDGAVEQAFRLMQQWNGPSPVSRIEQVTSSQKQLLGRTELHFYKKDGDYLYSSSSLSALAGDRYKSQRALCNRAERQQLLVWEPYRLEHLEGCTRLFQRWAVQKRQSNLDSFEKLLLEDAEPAHLRVCTEHEQVGISGMVVKSQNTIVAYTFGYWLTPRTWCVLLEVADRSIPGLAQWVFRETCRQAQDRGAVFINTMDDAGLPGLRQAKQAYHPTAMIEAWVGTRGGS